MIEKRQNEWGIDLFELQRRGRHLILLTGELEE
jgi:hypothetical protein